MFTGLIETKGKVLANYSNGSANRLSLSATMSDLQVGESIAVNGVCLTLLPFEVPGVLHFDVSPETLKCTTLGRLALGDFVNLERAMLVSARLGGHYVSGHVDTTVHIASIRSVGDYIELTLSGFNEQELLYLVPKGSITVEGVSLTINEVTDGVAKLMLVPHTLLHTTLGALEAGSFVNIEFDYVTRIVAHQLQLFGKVNCEVAS